MCVEEGRGREGGRLWVHLRGEGIEIILVIYKGGGGGGGSEIINPWRRVVIIILRHTGVGVGVGWSEFSFHKKCLSFCGGSSTFLSPIWRGGERGRKNI